MNQWIILLISLLILIVPSQQTHPYYSYVCREDGSIDVLGITVGSFVSGVETQYSGSPSPTPTPPSESKCPKKIMLKLERVTIPKGCFSAPFIANGTNRTVHIHVYDPAFATTTKAVGTPGSSKNITGGKQFNQYILTCNGIPIKGVIKTVVGRFNAKLEELIPTQIIETSKIQMTFRGTGDVADPTISSLYIGDSFYMFLRYNGRQLYTLEPYLCTAFGGNMANDSLASDKKISLWDIQVKSSCVPAKALAYKIVESNGFVYESSTVVKMHMFAFHFTNSDYITIECKVNVKPQLASVIPGHPKVCSGSQRRRRDSPVNRNDHQYTVHSTLKVRNELSPNKGNSIIQSWTIMSSVILSGVMVMKGV